VALFGVVTREVVRTVEAGGQLMPSWEMGVRITPISEVSWAIAKNAQNRRERRVGRMAEDEK
jgi:hypothetical protein